MPQRNLFIKIEVQMKNNKTFSHFDSEGKAIMVDISDKENTERLATASSSNRPALLVMIFIASLTLIISSKCPRFSSRFIYQLSFIDDHFFINSFTHIIYC